MQSLSVDGADAQALAEDGSAAENDGNHSNENVLMVEENKPNPTSTEPPLFCSNSNLLSSSQQPAPQPPVIQEDVVENCLEHRVSQVQNNQSLSQPPPLTQLRPQQQGQTKDNVFILEESFLKLFHHSN